MTDMVNRLNIGMEPQQSSGVARGFRKGAEAINLAAIFQARGITFRPTDVPGNEKQFLLLCVIKIPQVILWDFFK